jgi:hypothetical protein
MGEATYDCAPEAPGAQDQRSDDALVNFLYMGSFLTFGKRGSKAVLSAWPQMNKSCTQNPIALNFEFSCWTTPGAVTAPHAARSASGKWAGHGLRFRPHLPAERPFPLDMGSIVTFWVPHARLSCK